MKINNLKWFLLEQLPLKGISGKRRLEHQTLIRKSQNFGENILQMMHIKSEINCTQITNNN
jgi:hypothetical protein